VHLADQLLLPLALAGAGSFRTIGLSSHSRTNLDIIRLFSSTRISARGDRDDVLVTFES
jgi:RNA 3'-terminal phosphate cyclase (ATP)